MVGGTTLRSQSVWFIAVAAAVPHPTDHVGISGVAATSYAVDSVDTAVVLGGGTPQGCPASPTIWVIVVDFALACARLQKGGEIKVQGEPLRVIAFADDLAATGKTAAALAETVQGLVTALGAIGVRFNARKSYYLWSAAAAWHTYGSTAK